MRAGRDACGRQEQKKRPRYPAHSSATALAETQQTSDPEPKKTRLLSVSQSDLFSCWLLATNINVDTVCRVASKEEAMPNRAHRCETTTDL
jgi:hypothetical protein